MLTSLGWLYPLALKPQTLVNKVLSPPGPWWEIAVQRGRGVLFQREPGPAESLQCRSCGCSLSSQSHNLGMGVCADPERVFSVKASGSGRELGRQGFRLWSPEALV